MKVLAWTIGPLSLLALGGLAYPLWSPPQEVPSSWERAVQEGSWPEAIAPQQKPSPAVEGEDPLLTPPSSSSLTEGSLDLQLSSSPAWFEEAGGKRGVAEVSLEAASSRPEARALLTWTMSSPLPPSLQVSAAWRDLHLKAPEGTFIPLPSTSKRTIVVDNLPPQLDGREDYRLQVEVSRQDGGRITPQESAAVVTALKKSEFSLQEVRSSS